MTDHKAPLTYKNAGVDIDAGNQLVDNIKPLIKNTYRSGVMGSIGGFGGVFDLKACGFEDPLLVAGNDGVGTKLKLAIDSHIHDTVGIDLVAMCVNDLIVQGAEPLFFLDYYATGALDPQIGTDIVKGIARGCEIAGCALIGGETAEMPGLYQGDDYDLAGFCVGAVERDQLLPRSDIKAGDLILGLEASGIHSNGFSLIRKLLDVKHVDILSPFPKSGKRFVDILLEPTRIYVKPLLNAQKATGNIKAMAHITGGGFVENIPRVLPDHLGAEIDLNALPSLPIYNWIFEQGIEPDEMLRTFNCGVGMVLVVERSVQDQVMHILKENDENPFILGQINERKSSNAVSFINSLAFTDE